MIQQLSIADLKAIIDFHKEKCNQYYKEVAELKNNLPSELFDFHYKQMNYYSDIFNGRLLKFTMEDSLHKDNKKPTENI